MRSLGIGAKWGFAVAAFSAANLAILAHTPLMSAVYAGCAVFWATCSLSLYLMLRLRT